MDEIYRNVWSAAGLSCAGTAALAAAIGTLIAAATLTVIWLLARFGIVRAAPAHDRLRSLRGIRIIMLAIGAMLALVAIYATLTSTTLHSARFGGGAIALDYCDGVRSRAERLSAGDVVAIRHRTITRYTRTGVTHDDEAVISTRAGAQFAIPLRLDRSVSDPAALTRHLPGTVLDAWDAALRSRGSAPLPPEWRR